MDQFSHSKWCQAYLARSRPIETTSTSTADLQPIADTTQDAVPAADMAGM